MNLENCEIVYGLRREDLRLVHITEVAPDRNGWKCGLVCPECQEDLIARRGKKNLYHFAHQVASKCKGGATETLLHRLAKQILVKRGEVALPYGFELLAGAAALTRLESPKEEPGAASPRPDVLATYAGTRKLAIEIWVTHAKSPEDIEAYRGVENQDVMEILLSQLRATFASLPPDVVAQHVIEAAPRRWLVRHSETKPDEPVVSPPAEPLLPVELVVEPMTEFTAGPELEPAVAPAAVPHKEPQPFVAPIPWLVRNYEIKPVVSLPAAPASSLGPRKGAIPRTQNYWKDAASRVCSYTWTWLVDVPLYSATHQWEKQYANGNFSHAGGSFAPDDLAHLLGREATRMRVEDEASVLASKLSVPYTRALALLVDSELAAPVPCRRIYRACAYLWKYRTGPGTPDNADMLCNPA